MASERPQVLADDHGGPVPPDRPATPRRGGRQPSWPCSRRRRIDGIVAVDDQGVLAAALAASRLGLPHNPPEAVMATRDKLAMRDAWRRPASRQPRFASVAVDEDVAEVAGDGRLSVRDQAHRRCPPAAASSGPTTRLERSWPATGSGPSSPTPVRTPAGRSSWRPTCPAPRCPSRACSVVGLLETLAVFDKPDPLEGPYFEETIYVTPSRLPQAAVAAVERTAAEACAAMGLVERPGPRRAAHRRSSGVADRGGGPLHRRPVLPRPLVRGRRQPRAADRAPMPSACLSTGSHGSDRPPGS